jgi:hypothetical protein
MLQLSCLITFTDASGKTYLSLPFVNEVEIDKSRKTLTNTAKITIPRKLNILVDILVFFLPLSSTWVKYAGNQVIDIKANFSNTTAGQSITVIENTITAAN